MSETPKWEIAPHNGIVSADPPFTDKLFASRMAVVARETATEYWEFAVVKEHAQLLADYLNVLEARAALADERGHDIRESMRRGDLDDWLARYDALTQGAEERRDE